jgi:hypothetical protein
MTLAILLKHRLDPKGRYVRPLKLIHGIWSTLGNIIGNMQLIALLIRGFGAMPARGPEVHGSGTCVHKHT